MLILFVEYHASFRQSASYVMDREADMEVVSQAGSVAEGREKMAQGGVYAAVVDVPLPDEGAAEMVGELYESNPSIPVLVLTRAEDPEASEAFLKAGASEVLSKECTFAQILAAVRRLGDEAWGQRAPIHRSACKDFPRTSRRGVLGRWRPRTLSRPRRPR